MSKLEEAPDDRVLTARRQCCCSLPAAGQAATNFGSRLKNEPTDNDLRRALGPCTIVSYIHPSDPNGDPYSGGAPVDGVITKFRIRAFARGRPGPDHLPGRRHHPARPKRPTTAPWPPRPGTGPTVTIQPDEAAPETPITEVAGRLPVKKGQHLAVDTTEIDRRRLQLSNGSKFSYVFAPPLVDGAGARGSTEVANELLVAATIEPDADGDGFGDETQDQCPSQATTQGACDIDRAGGQRLEGQQRQDLLQPLRGGDRSASQLEKKSAGRKVGKKCVKQTREEQDQETLPELQAGRRRFSGPGNAGANKVTLPNGKKLEPGSYRLTMTARDVAGNETTKTTTFKVAKKKKKKGK